MAKKNEIKLDPKNTRKHGKKSNDIIDKSLEENGAGRSILLDSDNGVIAGNGVYDRASKKKIPIRIIETDGKELIAVKRTDLAPGSEKRRRLAVADNATQEHSEFDWEELTEDEIIEWGIDTSERPEPEEKDDKPKVEQFDIHGFIDTDIKIGDLFQLTSGGNVHHLMCGDSTITDNINKLIGENQISILHADPPYGMGKQKDGVLNDNIYNEELDKFQMSWINEALPKLSEKASIYIWGNPEPLWRLWFSGGLSEVEKLTFKNQIVWDKKVIPGMASPLLTQYPIVSEHCLFIQKGEQLRGNVNKEDFWEGFEPIRSYLASEATRLNIKPKDILEVCGVGMFSYWFSKSQWCLIPENQYEKLQAKYEGFSKSWSDLRTEYKEELEGTADNRLGGLRNYRTENRPFFNNAHDIMSDVWDYPRVLGEERYGHATPKPVEMIERIIKSSSQLEENIFEPFIGSGSTMVACNRMKRNCYGMELDPNYCAITVMRMISGDKNMTVTRNGKDQTKYWRQLSNSYAKAIDS